jgi:cobalt-zinc-cadmium resistance protein CzcA
MLSKSKWMPGFQFGNKNGEQCRFRTDHYLNCLLPIFTLTGNRRKNVQADGANRCFCINWSIFTVTDLYSDDELTGIKQKEKTKDNISDRVMAKVETGHQKLLIKALKFRKTIIATVIVLFAGAVFTLSKMGGEFIPSLEEGDFAVEMRILQGSNIEETKKVTTQAAKILLKQFPEVQKVVMKIGSGEIPTDPMPMDGGDMIVVLKPKKEWTCTFVPRTFRENE